MRYPENIKKGNAIAFVAPSYGANIEPYKSLVPASKHCLENMGFKVEYGPNAFLGEGVGISNTPFACAKELTDYYCDENNDALISVGGGELMCEIIDYIDFAKIKKSKAKWFMGYSDNTNFVFLLTTLCDVASIYGYNAATFGMDNLHESCIDMLGIIQGQRNVHGFPKWEIEEYKSVDNPYAGFNLTEPHKHVSYIGSSKVDSVQFEGRFLGGCLDCLINLCGTKYDKVKEFIEKYKDDGIVWFLESCELSPVSVRRAMWELKNAGWFKYAKGFIIGRPATYGMDSFGIDHENAILEHIKDLNIPIIRDVDIGHLQPSIPIVCGSYGKVSSDNYVEIQFLEK